MLRASIQLRDFLKKAPPPSPQIPYLIVIDMWGRTIKSDDLSIFGHWLLCSGGPSTTSGISKGAPTRHSCWHADRCPIGKGRQITSTLKAWHNWNILWVLQMNNYQLLKFDNKKILLIRQNFTNVFQLLLANMLCDVPNFLDLHHIV